MTGSIVIIGWGSLLWDLDNLEPHVTGHWALERGPTIPLEFVRVSPKRLNALTVVIDSANGVPCRTSYTTSLRTDTRDAVLDLAARERADPDHIGYVDIRTGDTQSRDSQMARLAADWLADNGHDAAVWTDLAGNFHEKTGDSYTLDRAASYLMVLTGASRIEAKRYIDSAPSAVDTPLRRRLNRLDWWRDIEY